MCGLWRGFLMSSRHLHLSTLYPTVLLDLVAHHGARTMSDSLSFAVVGERI